MKTPSYACLNAEVCSVINLWLKFTKNGTVVNWGCVGADGVSMSNEACILFLLIVHQLESFSRSYCCWTTFGTSSPTIVPPSLKYFVSSINMPFELTNTWSNFYYFLVNFNRRFIFCSVKNEKHCTLQQSYMHNLESSYLLMWINPLCDAVVAKFLQCIQNLKNTLPWKFQLILFSRHREKNREIYF